MHWLQWAWLIGKKLTRIVFNFFTKEWKDFLLRLREGRNSSFDSRFRQKDIIFTYEFHGLLYLRFWFVILTSDFVVHEHADIQTYGQRSVSNKVPLGAKLKKKLGRYTVLQSSAFRRCLVSSLLRVWRQTYRIGTFVRKPPAGNVAKRWNYKVNLIYLFKY